MKIFRINNIHIRINVNFNCLLDTLKTKSESLTMGAKIKNRIAKFARKTMKLMTNKPMFGSWIIMTRGTDAFAKVDNEVKYQTEVWMCVHQCWAL